MSIDFSCFSLKVCPTWWWMENFCAPVVDLPTMPLLKWFLESECPRFFFLPSRSIFFLFWICFFCIKSSDLHTLYFPDCMPVRRWTFGVAVWYFTLFLLALCVSRLQSKKNFKVFSIIRSGVYQMLVCSFQLPFDDEHVPTLFRKIKCKGFNGVFCFPVECF